jgi:hypothetical protein
MTKIMVNNVLRDMTPEEEEQRTIDVANAQSKKETEEQAKLDAQAEKEAKETAQASGNQKLLDLGLTQDEATALTGYTPPSED